VEEIVHDVTALISSGKARAWGVLNWPAALIAKAAEVAHAAGAPPPSAAQLAYSLVRRSPVEDRDTIDALHSAGTSVVASFVLDGGALTGKYATPGTSGRLSDSLQDRRYADALAAGAALGTLAERIGVTRAPLAIAFALLNTDVASVLFGATRPEQVRENVRAVELLSTLDEASIAELRRTGKQPPPHPDGGSGGV
jgi:aryl-alcohol dehydrogenase-like predicted oxidoreductase